MKKTILLYIAVILAVTLTPFIGREGIIDLNEQGLYILENLRFPRVYLAFLVGGILSVIGSTTQVIFRNPLATPYTLGFSSVAALGLAIAELGFNSFSLGAYIALSSIFLLILLFLYLNKFSSQRVLLFGVCLSIFSSSAIVFVQSILGNESIARLIRWMMGSLSIVGFEGLLYTAPLYILGLIFFVIHKRSLTLISIGEDFAQTRGVPTRKVNATLILVSNILIAVVVWQCGPIGFVGLIIPHITRRLVSANYERSLMPTFILGGGFLVLCDFISRIVLANSIIPIGAITACVGAPVLALQLFKQSES
ncbi:MULTISPECIES: FecCD family ABC transporter permease [unclassified Halobacteriovorax]|uniref:FecCD family ABC transporter permease n=1 Tax=unclassified Halobacteriovorax TaxID=2639665 RepID=UPI00399B2CBF